MFATEKQIAALLYKIARAKLDPKKPEISKLVQKLAWHLIKASNGMTQPVFVTLHQDTGDFTPDEISEIAHLAGELGGEYYGLHLGALLALTGSDFRLTIHYGAYNSDGEWSNDGQIPDQDGSGKAPMRCTFWLGPDWYAQNKATEVPVTRATLEAIDLTKDGLHKH